MTAMRRDKTSENSGYEDKWEDCNGVGAHNGDEQQRIHDSDASDGLRLFDNPKKVANQNSASKQWPDNGEAQIQGVPALVPHADDLQLIRQTARQRYMRAIYCFVTFTKRSG